MGWRSSIPAERYHLVGRASALANVLTGRLGFHSSVRTLFPLPRRDRESALQALARVDLLGKALERADRLSGGEQQRVGIARALAQQPRRILADEPVASLDPVTAKHVLGLLQQICREDGITAIVSLHQVDLALLHADRILGLAKGHVVLDAKPSDLDASSLDALYMRGRSPPPAHVVPESEPVASPLHAA